jgi:hypothetical protein
VLISFQDQGVDLGRYEAHQAQEDNSNSVEPNQRPAHQVQEDSSSSSSSGSEEEETDDKDYEQRDNSISSSSSSSSE